MFRGKKFVIFDMDGTLIDSIGLWNEIDRELIRRIDRTGAGEPNLAALQQRRDAKLREFSKAVNPYLEYVGCLCEVYRADMNAEEALELRCAISQEYLERRVDYKPGVPAFLARLRAAGFTLAIATTTKRSNMNTYRTMNPNILAKAPLDETFSLVLTLEDAKNVKPHPEIYETAMGRLGAVPEECLVFEDSLIGIEAAHRAGVETVAIWDAYSEGERVQINALADYHFRDYAEAMVVLEKELQE